MSCIKASLGWLYTPFDGSLKSNNLVIKDDKKIVICFSFNHDSDLNLSVKILGDPGHFISVQRHQNLIWVSSWSLLGKWLVVKRPKETQTSPFAFACFFDKWDHEFILYWFWLDIIVSIEMFYIFHLFSSISSKTYLFYFCCVLTPLEILNGWLIIRLLIHKWVFWYFICHGLR